MPWTFTTGGQDYLVTDRWSLANPGDMQNIHAEIRALDGRRPKDAFGEDIPLGEIIFTDWAPDTCGCVHRYLNRRDGIGETVPHRGVRHCDAHKHHEGDHVAHFSAILRENRHKNETLSAHAAAHGIVNEDGEPDPAQISFAYDDNRRLVISHPAFGKKVVPQVSVN